MMSRSNDHGIELVLFDLGRVLIQICDDWKHACRIAGVTIPADLAEPDEALVARAATVIERYDTGKIDGVTFAQEIAPLRGLAPEQVHAFHNAFLRGPFAGGAELIDELHARGVRTACLSNTGEVHWRQMNDPDDPNFFPLDRLTWRFASHHIGVMKPHDGIYEFVERTTKLAPSSMLFFDDLEPNVAAAQRRGWQAHQIRIDADPIAQMRRVLHDRGVLR
jgi:FMN phosphatase YigB (HAD superfamily)